MPWSLWVHAHGHSWWLAWLRPPTDSAAAAGGPATDAGPLS